LIGCVHSRSKNSPGRAALKQPEALVRFGQSVFQTAGINGFRCRRHPL